MQVIESGENPNDQNLPMQNDVHRIVKDAITQQTSNFVTKEMFQSAIDQLYIVMGIINDNPSDQQQPCEFVCHITDNQQKENVEETTRKNSDDTPEKLVDRSSHTGDAEVTVDELFCVSDETPQKTNPIPILESTPADNFPLASQPTASPEDFSLEQYFGFATKSPTPDPFESPMLAAHPETRKKAYSVCGDMLVDRKSNNTEKAVCARSQYGGDDGNLFDDVESIFAEYQQADIFGDGDTDGQEQQEVV